MRRGARRWRFPRDHSAGDLGQLGPGEFPDECLSAELLPPGLPLTIEHDRVVVPEVSGGSEIDQLTVECALEDEGGVAERAERHRCRGHADCVVHDLVPDQDLNRIDAHVTVELEDDHRLPRIDVRGCSLDSRERRCIDRWNPVLPWPSALTLAERNECVREIRLPASGRETKHLVGSVLHLVEVGLVALRPADVSPPPVGAIVAPLRSLLKL